MNEAKSTAIEKLKEKINDLENIIGKQDAMIEKYQEYETELETKMSQLELSIEQEGKQPINRNLDLVNSGNFR